MAKTQNKRDSARPAGARHINITTRFARLTTIAVVIGIGGVAIVALQAQSAPQTTTPPAAAATAATPVNPKIDGYKREIIADIDSRREFTQQMIDQVFSYGEPAFQEVETGNYLTGILEKNGFRVERGYAGMPTAWVATWGSGKPVIALGSDDDSLLESSQKPGVAYHDPLVEGAPGHGEGHNSGVPLNITAALAVKKIMERDHLPGTLKLWPGIAEEVVGRQGLLRQGGVVQGCRHLAVRARRRRTSAPAGAPAPGPGCSRSSTPSPERARTPPAQPWRGRSALDAVELMDVGWNFRREHLRLSAALALRDHRRRCSAQRRAVERQRLVLTSARPITSTSRSCARSATRSPTAPPMMTDTTVTARLLGSAWLAHMNKTVAEAIYANIVVGRTAEVGRRRPDAREGVTEGTEAAGDRPGVAAAAVARRACRPTRTTAADRTTSATSRGTCRPRRSAIRPTFPNLPGHHWANAVAMATPIAHKGATAGAKAQAMTMLDFLLRPELVAQARAYFEEQTKTQKYQPFIGPEDQPAIHLNDRVVDPVRPAMRQFYFDPLKYKTYLEQLGITYPTVRKGAQ